ncbi:MAG: AsnC family transcriptional regulator, partial [Candidatus Competibacteraceae bacterium]|nr:AsnC family transcriptional regulator [Candidatus Competibacteraceae bacterium]
MPLDPVDKRLLNDFQRGLPLEPRPYQAMARRLGIAEAEVITRLERLLDAGVVSRVGPVFAPRRVGASTLAAMAVPPGDLEQVAARISAFAEVNHNYEREHPFNLWFVVTAPDQAHLDATLRAMEAATGLPIMSLPL